MIKISYITRLCLFIGVCFMFVACHFNEGMSPELDTTDLWPAATTYECYSLFPDDHDAPYPEELLYGYINRQGEMVIQPQFVGAGSFSCGFAPVYLLGEDNRYASNKEPAFINKNGKVFHINNIEEKEYFSLTPFYHNIATLYFAWSNSGDPVVSYMVNTNMNIISERIQPGKLYPMTADGLAAYVGFPDYKNKYEVSHFNKSGKKVLQTLDASGGDPDFNGGYIVVLLNTKYCVVNTKGKILYEDSHSLRNLGHGRFLRQYDTIASADQFDVIDAYGNVLGSENFNAPAWPKEELFLVTRTEHEQLYGVDGLYAPIYYYINQDGKQTFQRFFEYAKPFSEGYALVLGEIINTSGETVLKLEPNESVISIHNGLVLTTKTEYFDNGKYAIITDFTYKDLTGKTIYSWQQKFLNSKNSAPSVNNEKQRITQFPEGLYILGDIPPSQKHSITACNKAYM